MRKRAAHKRNFMIINGQKIYISKELERELLRDISDTRNKARRDKACSQSDFQKCSGDCSFCPWHQNGILLSIHNPSAVPANALTSGEDVEEAIIWKLTLEKIYAFADSNVPNGSELLKKRFVEQMTLRSIASKLDLQPTVVARRLNRLITLLQENQNLFF